VSPANVDSRAWVAWGAAAMLPPLLGRNPWVLLEVLVIVLVVRAIWIPPATAQGMGWFLRVAGVFVVMGVVFNVLTVHAGTTVLATLPGSWPIVGGDLTLNALVYGVLGGVALFSLVLTGITVGTLVSWIDLFHALPPRLAPIAVTGSVAWSFLPQLATTWQNIREAQTMRGHRLRGARDILPLVTPLLASSLDRSLMMAEVLEARGFGALAAPAPTAPTRAIRSRLTIVMGLVALAAGGYCLAVGIAAPGALGLAAGAGLVWAGVRAGGPPGPRRTRLRCHTWTRRDTLVVATSLLAAIGTIAWTALQPESASYRVYPDLTLPTASLWILLSLALLLTPAFLAGEAGP
jgi:energy-coupling factor transport system permease protein